MSDIWLSPEVLAWQAIAQTSTVNDGPGWRRSYKHWEHADAKAQQSTTDTDRGDVIAALKRALVFRVVDLSRAYDLRVLPLPDKPREQLGVLEYLGIVRTIMYRKLVAIRDSYEHEGTPPPGEQECRELVEYVWYFLRSTDSFLTKIRHDFSLSADDDMDPTYFLDVRTGPEEKWRTTILGQLPDGLVSHSERRDWIRASVIDVGPRSETSRREDQPTSTFIHAEVVGPTAHLRALIRLMFQAT